MDYSNYPFRIADITLLQCNTGYVYMIVSMIDRSYAHIGLTNSIRNHLNQHNYRGTQSTQLEHLKPFMMYAYICGFNNYGPLMASVESQWKIQRNRSISVGINDLNQCVQDGEGVIFNISNTNSEQYTSEAKELKMVKLIA